MIFRRSIFKMKKQEDIGGIDLKRRVFVVLIVSILFLLVGCVRQEGSKDLTNVEDTEKNQQKGQEGEVDAEDSEPEQIEAPDFEIKNMDGEMVHLSDYQGKVLVLNFWGTWCAPCQSEMPGFQKVYENYQEASAPVEFIMVNGLFAPRELKEEEVIEWTQEKGYTFPIFFDEDGSINELYQVPGFPTTYIIQQDGYVVAGQVGPISEENLRKIIDSLL